MKLLGLDIGTTTISGVVLDRDTGDLLASLTLKNDSFISLPDKPYRKCQDANRIEEIVRNIKQELTQKVGGVDAIGVTGQMHGVVYIDGLGKAISPLYTWQDGAGSLNHGVTTYSEYLSAITGYKLASGYGLVTHFVNRELGEVPDGVRYMCTIHDYIAMSLAGENQPLMHSSDAASFGCFNLSKMDFDETALKNLMISRSLLPEVVEGTAVVGNDENGVPVSVAIGDNQASVLGSLKDGRVLVNIGTGSQVSVVTDGIVNYSGETRPLNGKEKLLVGAPLCGGRAFSMLNKFFTECGKLFGKEDVNVYAVMDALAEKESECHPLNVDTRFCGTRENPDLKGSISGITEENFTAENLTRGFLWGMATELYSYYEDMKCHLDSSPEYIVGSGNAIRKSPVLRQYIADVFGAPVLIPRHTEEAAFGAALFGGVAAGFYEDLKSAKAIAIKYFN